MTEGVREAAIKAGIIEQQVFEQGIRDYIEPQRWTEYSVIRSFKAHCAV